MLELLMLLIGCFCLFGSFLMEGGSLSSIFLFTAALIVFGGTFAAIGMSYTINDFKQLPKSVYKVFVHEHFDYYEIIDYYKHISIKVRTEGYLFLEEEIKNNTLLNKIDLIGLQLKLDNVDVTISREILQNYIQMEEDTMETQANIFDAAGGYSPAMGMIGTVLGLINVLGNITDTASLGSKIAVAFITTFYGVAAANLIFLPMGNKLRIENEKILKQYYLSMEGILCLIDNSSANVLEDRLKSIIGG